MSDMTYSTLGRSGLVVSPFALGTMTFGAQRWGCDEASARAVFDAYRDRGGNFIDTADVYGGGQSEAMLGRFIADSKSREDVVLATKFGFNSGSSPLDATPGRTRGPHGGGAGAKHIHQALEASLRRLGTDYVDLYWMHIWDGITPVEEIVQVLGGLVQAGKIRYYGLSDMPAWVAMKAATLATERGVPGPIAIQVEYSLVARDIEREHVPVAREGRMGVVPWSPLAGGFLTGKYRRDESPKGGRLSSANPFGDSKFTDANWDAIEVVVSVAGEQGCTPAQVALAWVSSQPGVTSTIIGARTVEQLGANLEAGSIVLTPEQMQRLSAACLPEPGFSGSLASRSIRAMLFGGHEVRGFGETKG